MWPELEAIVNAWNAEADARAASGTAAPIELGRRAEGGCPDFCRIQIANIALGQAHYEFLVRGRAAVGGGVIGAELHIETHHPDAAILCANLRSTLQHTFHKISAEHWRFGDRLSFLLPAKMPPTQAVDWMQRLIVATRQHVVAWFAAGDRRTLPGGCTTAGNHQPAQCPFT